MPNNGSTYTFALFLCRYPIQATPYIPQPQYLLNKIQKLLHFNGTRINTTPITSSSFTDHFTNFAKNPLMPPGFQYSSKT